MSGFIALLCALLPGSCSRALVIRPSTLTGVLVLAVTLLALGAPGATLAADDAIAPRRLRAKVTVTSEVVRVGDVIDNAGSLASIPIYRSPDLGTTGTLPVAELIATLSARQVIGVDTTDIKEVTVTRIARTLANKELEQAVGAALEHRFGLGDAANLAVSLDRGISDIRLDASNAGPLQARAAHYDARTGRFDVMFEIANDTAVPGRVRVTGTAVETTEVAVLTRDVEQTEILKASDIAVVRRPKAEIAGEIAPRERAIGMQPRRPLRAGTPVRLADLARPDLVQRDQSVTVIYQMPGLYLTTRGKALENGAEGDVVGVVNLQSKRTITGVVSGRGQVTITVTASTPPAETSSVRQDQAPVALASSQISPVNTKPE